MVRLTRRNFLKSIILDEKAHFITIVKVRKRDVTKKKKKDSMFVLNFGQTQNNYMALPTFVRK